MNTCNQYCAETPHPGGKGESSTQTLFIHMQSTVKFPLQLCWMCGSDMPFKMGFYVQSVVVNGTVCVGGGLAGGGDAYIVMEYDISSGKWTKYLPYRACAFAMTVINDQLVLVGGDEHGRKSKVLGVWRADMKAWTHPYPDMLTARSHCSAVAYNEWLVVAGGLIGGHGVAYVQVMNAESKQWYVGPPTPTPWSCMKTAIVGDTCYFMGGFTTELGYSTDKVYGMSLPALLSHLRSQDSREGGKQDQMWTEISGLEIIWSTPLSISGSLLAVGRCDKGHNAVSAIHLYQPDTGEWETCQLLKAVVLLPWLQIR